MKRAKRDQTERAFKQGYCSGLKGHSSDLCPFQQSPKKDDWIGGWRTGHADYRAGFRQGEELLH